MRFSKLLSRFVFFVVGQFLLSGIVQSAAANLNCFNLRKTPFYEQNKESLSMHVFRMFYTRRLAAMFRDREKTLDGQLEGSRIVTEAFGKPHERLNEATRIWNWLSNQFIAHQGLRDQFVALMDFSKKKSHPEAYLRTQNSFLSFFQGQYEKDFPGARSLEDGSIAFFGLPFEKLVLPGKDSGSGPDSGLVQALKEIGSPQERWAWQVAVPKEFQTSSFAPYSIERWVEDWKRFSVAGVPFPLLRMGSLFYLPRHLFLQKRAKLGPFSIEFKSIGGVLRKVNYMEIGSLRDASLRDADDFVALSLDLTEAELREIPDFEAPRYQVQFENNTTLKNVNLGSLTPVNHSPLFRVRAEHSPNRLLYSTGWALGRDGKYIVSGHLSYDGGMGFPVFNLDSQEIVGVNFRAVGFRQDPSSNSTRVLNRYKRRVLLVPAEVTLIYPIVDIQKYHEKALGFLKPTSPQ